MKKLMLILPLLLIALNFLPVSLYKQKVNFGSTLDTLSPSYWRPIQLDLSFSANLNQGTPNNSQGAQSLSDGANFRGFPIGAYFSKNIDTKTSGSAIGVNTSAWSWLWAGVDALALILVGVGSFLAYRLRS